MKPLLWWLRRGISRAVWDISYSVSVTRPSFTQSSSPLSEVTIYSEMKLQHCGLLLYPVEELWSPLLFLCLCGVSAPFCWRTVRLRVHPTLLLLSSHCCVILILCLHFRLHQWTYFLVFSSSFHEFFQTCFVFVFTQSLKSYVTKINSEVIAISSFRVRIFTCIIFMCFTTNTGDSSTEQM